MYRSVLNDVETPLGRLSYLVAFKTFLRVRPRINNEVSPGVALALCPGRDWRRQARARTFQLEMDVTTLRCSDRQSLASGAVA